MQDSWGKPEMAINMNIFFGGNQMLDLVTVILAAGKGRTEERSFELYQGTRQGILYR